MGEVRSVVDYSQSRRPQKLGGLNETLHSHAFVFVAGDEQARYLEHVLFFVEVRGLVAARHDPVERQVSKVIDGARPVL